MQWGGGGVEFYFNASNEHSQLQITVFEVKCKFWPFNLELKWSQDKSIHRLFIVLCIYVDDVQMVGGALEDVQVFILVEGLKIEGFLFFFFFVLCFVALSGSMCNNPKDIEDYVE